MRRENRDRPLSGADANDSTPMTEVNATDATQEAPALRQGQWSFLPPLVRSTVPCADARPFVPARTPQRAHPVGHPAQRFAFGEVVAKARVVVATPSLYPLIAQRAFLELKSLAGPRP